ncbi:hypothetical protein CSUB01_12680 [Colletotrichum sublineola]|uniref:Uncharacterized protein n=1 Tax=Colletotrichum sublineola TaxID=1173701 RepID=A0A066XGC3_COLSU|nr:hypothetical protein CSUB01_12680 [Colletotrichum sublineola]
MEVTGHAEASPVLGAVGTILLVAPTDKGSLEAADETRERLPRVRRMPHPVLAHAEDPGRPDERAPELIAGNVVFRHGEAKPTPAESRACPALKVRVIKLAQ